ETRMELAVQGLPSPQNIGYALFDENSIGMTDFLQKVNYRRALEGELSRTIIGLDEVEAARVHLVIPEERLFQEDENPPTASVVLKVKGTAKLRERQLQGISYLVASAVEGMSPDHVTMIDYDGNLLSSQMGSDESAMLSSTQFEMRKNVEKYLESKAQSMLAGVIGQGRAIVRVTADLNFQRINTTVESFNPDSVAIRSEQRTVQRGTETSGTRDTSSTATAARTDDQLEDVITNYEVPRKVSNIISEVGNINRLTVAVLVDGKYQVNETPEGISETEYIPRAQEELDRFAAIIKNAVGFTETRDNFEIVNVPFDNKMLQDAQEALDTGVNWNSYIGYAKQVATAVLLILAFFYVKKRLKRVFSAIAKYAPPPPALRHSVEQEIVQQPQKPKLIDTMKTQAQGKHDEIAKVIKTMMSE
ncbi:MAG: flagellar basal-body MS-ring/collar protein FliF, partial [bacterium]